MFFGLFKKKKKIRIMAENAKSLRRDRIYVVEIPKDTTEEEIDAVHSFSDMMKRQYRIDLVFITEGLKFIDLPEGYEIKKV